MGSDQVSVGWLQKTFQVQLELFYSLSWSDVVVLNMTGRHLSKRVGAVEAS